MRIGLSPIRRARERIVSGFISGASADGVITRRVTTVPRSAKSCTTRSRSSKSPTTGTPRIDWPRSAGDGERMPTTCSFWNAPLSLPRSGTSASAAGPSTMVGASVAAPRMLQRTGVAEIAVGDARAREEGHLQEPVQRDGDLAEEERAVDVRRQQHIVEHEQRDRQHRRHLDDVHQVRQRGEAPLVLVEPEDREHAGGIDRRSRAAEAAAGASAPRAPPPRSGCRTPRPPPRPRRGGRARG